MGDSILPGYNTVRYGPTGTSSSATSTATNDGVLAVSTTGTATSSAAATSTSSASTNQFGYGNSSSFYRNLFYILIALLLTFGVISILSWFRTRRRRLLIFHEAQRLNLLVPGMPGYAAERERVLLLMGGITVGGGMGGRRGGDSGGPGLWDIRDGEREKELIRRAMEEEEERIERGDHNGRYNPAAMALNPSPTNPDFFPLSAKPVIHVPPQELKPMPVSTLPFFPQEHALRRPPPSVETEGIVETWEEEGMDGLGAGVAASEEQTKVQEGQPSLAQSQIRPRGISYPPPPGLPPASSRVGFATTLNRADTRQIIPPPPISPDNLASKRAVELSFLIRMPVPVAPKSGPRKPREGIVPGTGEVYRENDEDDVDNAIMDEWQGAEFGVVEIPVLVDTLPSGPKVAGEQGEVTNVTRHDGPAAPGVAWDPHALPMMASRQTVRQTSQQRVGGISAAPAGFQTPSSPYGLIR